MMLRQIKYFQSVVRLNSFTKAAEENFISQSAISQQIQALEQQLGVKLLTRENRKFTLTPAGDFFYHKSLRITSDIEKLCRETGKLARTNESELTIGYLRGYSGNELQLAIADFSEKYPDVEINLISGNHEELYDMLRFGKVDIVINDQRRAFSEEYNNLLLCDHAMFIEISSRNQLANQSNVDIDSLKDIPCILVSSQSQQENEKNYYHEIIGIGGEFLFAENLEEARMMIVGGKGYMPVEISNNQTPFGLTIRRIPLLRKGKAIHHNICAFWKADNEINNINDFADIIKSKFFDNL